MRILKITLTAIAVIVGIILIVAGVKIDDITEIITNGTILCLSCIGIG